MKLGYVDTSCARSSNGNMMIDSVNVDSDGPTPVVPARLTVPNLAITPQELRAVSNQLGGHIDATAINVAIDQEHT